MRAWGTLAGISTSSPLLNWLDAYYEVNDPEVSVSKDSGEVIRPACHQGHVGLGSCRFPLEVSRLETGLVVLVDVEPPTLLVLRRAPLGEDDLRLLGEDDLWLLAFAAITFWGHRHSCFNGHGLRHV